jgi:hypothetical protein
MAAGGSIEGTSGHVQGEGAHISKLFLAVAVVFVRGARAQCCACLLSKQH